MHYGLEERIVAELERTNSLLERLLRVSEPKRLTTIKISFKESKVPTADSVILVSAGQQAVASILGFDQFGNPWTGAIPEVTYSIDNDAIATSTPNADNETDVVEAVANGTANLTATLTTAEGLDLTDTEQVIVNIPAPPPPPVPVLTSIKIAFAPVAAPAAE